MITIKNWHFVLRFYERMEYMDGRRTFEFSIFKVIKKPQPGVMLMAKENYKGFRFFITILLKRGL